MAVDSFTDTSPDTASNGCPAFIIGLILICVAFWLLVTNEGRAVKTQKALNEGGRIVTPVISSSVDAANEGNLIYVSDEANSREKISDRMFGLSAHVLKLKRDVQMYQWNEVKTTHRVHVFGNTTSYFTTYAYNKDWMPSPADSSAFYNPTGHHNPPRNCADKLIIAHKVTVGAFTLANSLVDKISNYQPTALSAYAATIPTKAAGRQVHIDSGKCYYLGDDPAHPHVGDIKVTFEEVPPEVVSIVAKQAGNNLAPYRTHRNGEIELLKTGYHDPAMMFKSAQQENLRTTWIYRFVGLIVMYFGFLCFGTSLMRFFSPVPIIGDIALISGYLLAFSLSATLSLLTIAAARIYYRPMESTLLIAAAIAVPIILRRVGKRKTR